MDKIIENVGKYLYWIQYSYFTFYTYETDFIFYETENVYVDIFGVAKQLLIK